MEQGWEEAGKSVGHGPFARVNARYSTSVTCVHEGAVWSHSNADDTMPVAWPVDVALLPTFALSIMLGSAKIFTPQHKQKMQRCNFHPTARQKMQSCNFHTTAPPKIQQTHILHASTQTHPGTYLREVWVLVRVVVVPEELCGPQVLLNHLDLGLITPCWAHQTQSVTHWPRDDSTLNAKPAHFVTSFSSDCYVVLCWLVE